MNEIYKYNDKVTTIGHENWPAQMANIASAMFGGNVTKLIVSMDRDGEYVVDLDDQVLLPLLMRMPAASY